MNYQELQRVNESLPTMDIKGKNYAQVHDRVRGFREIFPEGRIETEIVCLEEKFCVIKASVFNEDGYLLSTGIAHEVKDNGYINKTSFIENCETSAVGRALGMLGIGIDTSISSADEIENAIAKQDKIKAEEKEAKKKAAMKPRTPRCSDEQKAEMNKLVEEKGNKLWSDYMKSKGYKSCKEMSKEEAEELINLYKEKSEDE